MKKLCRSPREERCISEVVCFDFFFPLFFWGDYMIQIDLSTLSGIWECHSWKETYKHSNIKQHQQNNHMHTETQHIKSWNGITLFVAGL